MFFLDKIKKKKLRRSVYLSGFFLSVHFAFTSYINSSFLATFVGETYVGVIFSIASILAIIFLFAIPTLIKQLGNVQLMATLNFILMGIIIVLASNNLAWVIISFFMAYYVLGLAIQYAIDLYLESVSDDEDTGQIRTLFLTVLHLALMTSLIITGFVLGDGNNYPLIFMISLLALIPFWFISSRKFEELEKEYETPPLKDVLVKLWKKETVKERNINKALAIDFLINFFYALMIIYMPIYLHQYIGLPWSEIGFIFAFMLLPFVIFLPPLGILADKKLGEKEILSTGLIIAGLSCVLIAITDSTNPIVWGLLLFLSRVGISAVEGMKESFLFKHINPGDAGILSISRNTRPLAYIIAPLIASLFLFFFDFSSLFIFLGLTTWFGLRYSLTMVDTK